MSVLFQGFGSSRYIYIYITHTHIYANDSYNGEEGDCTSLFGQLALEIIWDVGSAT